MSWLIMIFPVTESTLSAHHLGKFLLKKYGLSTETNCKLFRTGINHLYQVTGGGSKYVCRVYNFAWRTKMEISEELRLLTYLKESGVPVSFPIADLSGEFISEINAPEGIRFCVLFSFADGKKSAKFSEIVSYNIGAAMGKFHSITRDFELKRVTYNSQVLLIESLKKTKSFFTNSTDEIDFIEKLTKSLYKEFKAVDVGNVRHGAVHLDIWFDNVHLKGEGEVTVFDFDFCGNGWQCLDISYYLYQLFYTNPDKHEYELKKENFFKGYESIITLSGEEKRIIPVLCLGILLFYLSVQCERYDTWSNIFLNEDHLKRFVSSLKKWIEVNGLNYL